MSQKILLVEGESDKDFFRELCCIIGLEKLDIKIRVSTPKDCGSRRDGKQSAINLLPLFMKQLTDGSITHLGMVVDADHVTDHGLGFARTLEQIIDTIRKFGYGVSSEPNTAGLIFPHSDGLSDFGLWIMPDNNLDGMLEDWLKQVVHINEKKLFEQVKSTVALLENPKFKPIHCSKAEVATWLAWQKIPGKGLYAAVTDNLIDMESESVKQLVSWLHQVYQ
ncbi:MAG: DUF3226 domain-containing protein [Pseudomonadota bacterium]